MPDIHAGKSGYLATDYIIWCEILGMVQLSGFIDKRALLHGVEVRIFSNTCDFEHGVLISTSS